MTQKIATAALREWMLKILTRKGQFAADAELVISRLLEAEQQGQTVGGLSAFGEILNAIDMGDVDPRARTLTVTETASMAVLDGSTGIGQVGASRAMLLALQKAAQTGIATVIVKNSQPLVDVTGIAALAAREGNIGFCAANWGKADREITPNGPLWLSSQPQAWALPDNVRVWVSKCDERNPVYPLLGVLTLAFTAGLTDSKFPSMKKRASPFGAGAEYMCIAIHPPTFAAGESIRRIGTELNTFADDGSAGWSAWPNEDVPDSFSLTAEVFESLKAAGQTARVPFPSEAQ